MALPAFVQAKSASTAGFLTSVAAAAFASTTTSGNTILAVIATNGNSVNDVSSVTDTGLNSYSRLQSTYDATDLFGLEFWIARNIAATASNVVTANDGASNLGSIVAMEISGIPTSGTVLDGYGSTLVFSLTESATTASNTTNANDIVIGVGIVDDGTAVFTVGSGFINLTQTKGSSAGIALGVQTKVISATGSQTSTMTSTTGTTPGTIAAVLVLSNTAIGGGGSTAHNLTLLGVGA